MLYNSARAATIKIDEGNKCFLLKTFRDKLVTLIKNISIIVIGFSFLAVQGMDNDIFERTGKEKYIPTWRVPLNKAGYKEMNSPQWFDLFRTACLASNNDFTDSKNPNLTINSVVDALGKDINTPLYQYKNGRDLKYYMYPIEALIWDRTNNTVLLEALLANGVPVNGYPDYSPIKDVLVRLASGIGNPTPSMLLQFLKILIKHKVSLDTKLPDHIGIEKQDTSLCCNCTAREFLNNPKVTWKDTAIKKQVEVLFTATLAPQPDSKMTVTQQPISGSSKSPSINGQVSPAIQPSQSTSQPHSGVISEVGKPSLPSVDPNVPTQTPTPALSNSKIANVPVRQLEPQATVTQQPTSGSSASPSINEQASSTIGPLEWFKRLAAFDCATMITGIIGLAALMAMVKMVWNRYSVEKTESPARIVITNKSDTAIALGYMGLHSDVMAGIVLKPGALWELDMNTIQLHLIITSHASLKNPLAINLEQYKLSASQEKRSLHITIHNNSWIQYWSTRVPYGYAVTWQ